VEYEWSDMYNLNYYRFIADDNNEKVYISNGILSFECIPYSAYEILVDSHVGGMMLVHKKQTRKQTIHTNWLYIVKI